MLIKKYGNNGHLNEKSKMWNSSASMIPFTYIKNSSEKVNVDMLVAESPF